jgi:hypothetical protein
MFDLVNSQHVLGGVTSSAAPRTIPKAKPIFPSKESRVDPQDTPAARTELPAHAALGVAKSAYKKIPGAVRQQFNSMRKVMKDHGVHGAKPSTSPQKSTAPAVVASRCHCGNGAAVPPMTHCRHCLEAMEQMWLATAQRTPPSAPVANVIPIPKSSDPTGAANIGLITDILQSAERVDAQGLSDHDAYVVEVVKT